MQSWVAFVGRSGPGWVQRDQVVLLCVCPWLMKTANIEITNIAAHLYMLFPPVLTHNPMRQIRLKGCDRPKVNPVSFMAEWQFEL